MSHNQGDDDDNSHFKIAGGTSGMKVSWQVTDTCRDPWANAYRVHFEEEKPDREQGYYIYLDLYDTPAEKKISHLLFPEEIPESLTHGYKPNNS